MISALPSPKDKWRPGKRGPLPLPWELRMSGKVVLVVTTPLGRKSFHDEIGIRQTAVQRGVICITTLTGANATASGIEALQRGRFDVRSLQEIHLGAVAMAKQ